MTSPSPVNEPPEVERASANPPIRLALELWIASIGPGSILTILVSIARVVMMEGGTALSWQRWASQGGFDSVERDINPRSVDRSLISWGMRDDEGMTSRSTSSPSKPIRGRSSGEMLHRVGRFPDQRTPGSCCICRYVSSRRISGRLTTRVSSGMWSMIEMPKKVKCSVKDVKPELEDCTM